MGEDDKIIRLVDHDDSNSLKHGYQPKTANKPEQRGHKPASALDTSKPPQGKGSGQQPEPKK